MDMLRRNTRRYISALLVAGSFCFISSCEKTSAPATDYKINGIKDIVLTENGSDKIELSVELLSKDAEQITLSIEGTPSGVSPNFDRVTDKPPFTASLYLKDDSSKGGEYVATLNAKSASGVAKSYTFKITTYDKTCSKKASGLYTGTSICRDGDGLIFGEFIFFEDPNDKSKLFFYWNKQLAYGVINCNKNSITIPVQRVGNFKIHGQGYLDNNYKLINFDYTETYDNGDTVSCNAHFIKK